MKFATAICFALLCAASTLYADIPRGWSTNFDDALENPGQRPVLAFFTASWCGPCKLMTAITLTDPAVLTALDRVQPVGVDIDEQSELAGQHGVEAVPTLILLTPSGREVDRITGYHVAEDFLNWLTNGITAVAAAETEEKRLKEQLAAAVQLAQSADTNFIAQSVAKLLDVFADADAPMQKTITAQLSSIAAQHPVLLLDGLNHSRLISRICAANLLRFRLGVAFDIDPWSDAGTRQKAVAAWKQKLAASH